MTGEPWMGKPAGIVLACRATPNGGRDAVEGVGTLADGSCVLLARVRAAPEAGGANRALCELLASALGVPASRVTIASGAKGRTKRLAIAGEPAVLVQRLRALCAARAAQPQASAPRRRSRQAPKGR